jgi:ubiquinone biosynthesis protein
MYKKWCFLFNMTFVVVYEWLLYVFFQDKFSFVCRLTNKLSRMNMLYVKIFQALALNISFVDETLDKYFTEFTDNAPYSSDDIDYLTLYNVSNEYNLDFNRCGFISPINSGMISLVFKAYDVSNNQMAVKIKRVDIEKKLEESIENLLFCVRIFFNNTQISEIIHKNIDIVKGQTSFSDEIRNMSTFKENCKNLDYVVIPKANNMITEKYPNVIVMDYIDGIKVEHISHSDRLLYAEQIIKVGLVTLFVHGFTHGDLHSGNIVFIRDADNNKMKLGILDFGIVNNICPTFKEIMLGLVIDIFDIPTEDMARRILLSGIIEPVDKIKKIPAEQFKIINDITIETLNDIIKDTNQIHVYKCIDRINELVKSECFKDLGIKVSDEFVKLQFVIAMSHGITMKLCGDKCIDLVDKVIRDLFHTDLLSYE